MLNNIPPAQRAVVLLLAAPSQRGLGNNAAALEQAKKATEMETAERRIRRLAAADGVRRQLVYRTTSTKSMVECRYPAAADFAGSCWQTLICNLCCGGGGLAGMLGQDIIYDRMLQSAFFIVEKGDTFGHNQIYLKSDRKYQKAW